MSLSLRRPATLLAVLVGCVAMLGGQRLNASLTRASPYLTRAEAATIILLANPSPLPTVTVTDRYVDVLPSDWFAPTMFAAAELGVVSPDTTGTKLRPFGTVNRAAFLVMLAKSFSLPLHGPHAFSDVPSNAWYAPYAGIEQSHRLFTHQHPSKLEPERLMTQDEAAAALKRFAALRSKEEDEQEQETAIAQTTGDVVLYAVISTKRMRVVFVDDGQRRFTGATFARASSSSASTAMPAVRTSIDDIRAEILSLVNAARAEKGLAPLRHDITLQTSAQAYANRMHADGFFGHTDPSGHTLQDRVMAVNYYERTMSDDCQCIKGFALGENIARGQRSAKEVVQAWMDSPSHRDAILGKDFTDLGIGVQSGVWVQHFGGLLVPER